jgi:hypothetical protein
VGAPVVRLVSWNIGGPGAGWPDVTALDADVALLQEAPTPPVELRGRVFPGADDGEWLTTGPEVRRWRTAIVRLTERVALEPRRQRPARHRVGHPRIQPDRILECGPAPPR